MWGLFSDEGCVDSGFFAKEDVEAALKTYSVEDGLVIREICPDHDEQPRIGCEECDAEL